MEVNQVNSLEQKRKLLVKDFWFLTFVIILNFLFFALKAISENAKSSYAEVLIGAYWFPVSFGAISLYAIIRLKGFLQKRLNATAARIVYCLLIGFAIFIAALILPLTILGSGHGGPLDFFYEKHLVSLIVVASLMMIPYIFVIIKLLRIKKHICNQS